MRAHLHTGCDNPVNLRWTRFPGMALSRQSIGQLAGVTLPQCRQMCLNNPACRYDVTTPDGVQV